MTRPTTFAIGALMLAGGAAVLALALHAHGARPPPAIRAEAVVAPPLPVATVDEAPEPAPVADAPFGPPRPPRKVLLAQSRVTPEIARTALQILSHPMGTEVVRTLDDRQYAYVVEPHYHSPTSGRKPVGWHKGVTVYALEAADQ